MGRREVDKIVDFEPSNRPNVFNLVLGHATPTGDIDDMANTNNGDMMKILATVIKIIVDFLDYRPQATITFRGNTDIRMNLYGRIVKRYHLQYSSEYNIQGIFLRSDELVTAAFDPDLQVQYEWYSIERKY